MNDLIDELSARAGTTVVINGCYDPIEIFNKKKFAELIVQRCTSIISLYKRDNLQDKAVADTLEAAYKEIKLTFGIK